MPKSVLRDGDDTGPSEKSHCQVLFYFLVMLKLLSLKREDGI